MSNKRAGGLSANLFHDTCILNYEHLKENAAGVEILACRNRRRHMDSFFNSDGGVSTMPNSISERNGNQECKWLHKRRLVAKYRKSIYEIIFWFRFIVLLFLLFRLNSCGAPN